MLADGTSPTEVTTGAVTDDHPDVSPDGTRLTWIRNGTQLWSANADGSGAANISPGGGTPNWPRYHPTTKQIVFTRGNDVAVINDDGTGFAVIQAGAAGAQRAYPQFNFTGSRIAFLRQTGAATYDLRAMDADGANDNLVATGITRAAGADFAWAHAANVIAYGTVANGGNVFKVNDDGTGSVQLNTVGFFGAAAALLPRYNWLADDSAVFTVKFVSVALGWQVYRLPADGSGEVALAPAIFTSGQIVENPRVYFDRVYLIKFVSPTRTFVSVASDGSGQRTEDTPGAQIDLWGP